MKKSKLLLLFLLLISVLTLAACDPEKFNNEETGVDESYLNVDLNQKPTMKVLFPNSGMANAEFKENWTTKYFENLTGYKVEYEQDLSGDSSFVTNILTTKQPYHMLKLESGNYLQLVSDGSFTDLKPFLEKYGQNLLSTIPQDAWDSVTIDGKIYAVPETGFEGALMSYALVWNLDQLSAVGINEIPDTIGEVDHAFHKLQEKYGVNGSAYHAFAMQGSQAYISTLASAFELNENFHVNDEGKVEHVMYTEEYSKYTKWMHGLVSSSIISRSWQGYTANDIVSNFAKGEIGCGYINYWSINSLVSKIAAQYGITEEEAKAKIGWTLYVKGDGACGSAVQDEPKYVAYSSTGYYCTVPIHMAKYAAYVVNWMDQRITTEAFEGYRLGDEGVHYNFGTAADEGAIKVMISGQEKYVILTDKYTEEILPTSMYQTGVNPQVGANLWILSEQSYNAWDIYFTPDAEHSIGNAISMAPYIEGWSEIDIASRSWVLTLEQQLFNAQTDAQYERILSSLRTAWPSRYWTAEVDANVQAWHQSKQQ